MKRAGAIGIFLLVSLLAPAAALAQRRHLRGVEAQETPPDNPQDLRGRFGLDRIESLLARDEPGATLRAIDRARTLGTPEALSLIAPQHDPLSHVRGDGRGAIALVRTLSEHTADTDARHALSAVMILPAGGGRRDERQIGAGDAERFELARGLAAMALAASHESEASALLESARASGGSPGRAATTALRAYPAQRLPDAPETTATSDDGRLPLAAASGDLRALGAIDRQLEPERDGGSEATRSGLRPAAAARRARAIESLAELGDTRVLALARAAGKDEAPPVRLAAARALVAFADEEAAAATAELLKDDATVKEGVELARAIGRGANAASSSRPSIRDLIRALAARLAATADVDLRRSCLAALGTFSAAESVAAIAPFLADPALAVDAAEALARSPRPEAANALVVLARAGGGATRLGLRAAMVRRALTGEPLPALEEVASGLASSPAVADRAVARAFLVVSRRLEPNLALADASPEVRRAVFAATPFERALAVHAAATDADPVVRALAYAQLENAAPELVGTVELTRRLRELEIDAPLAARVLASRATVTDAPVLALLHAPDPLVQREAVVGYARSTAPDRSGYLADLALYGADVEIRRAAIAGLASQDDLSSAIVDLLAVSARLDPDALCRALAGGVRLVDDAGEVAWLHSDHRPDGLPYEALLTTSSGVRALAFDTDGDAIVLGVSAAPKQLRLAPRVPAYDPASPPR